MPSQSLWRAREEALSHLRHENREFPELIDDLIVLIDETIDIYEANSGSHTYAQVCGLTLLKAKNLGIGAYSLILDGLGQEAGALLRPFIEYVELLTYLKRFPGKAEIVANGGKLPRAGLRAKAVGSIYREFREHLNQHASHSSYSPYSLAHLLEPDTHRYKKFQRTVPRVLDKNVRDFTVQLYLLLHEGVMGLESFAMPDLLRIGPRSDALHARLLSMLGVSPNSRMETDA